MEEVEIEREGIRRGGTLEVRDRQAKRSREEENVRKRRGVERWGYC